MTTTHVNTILRWTDGARGEVSDILATEEPLEIRVRGRAISVTMRTPGDDAELAVGFLLSEGIVHQSADVLRVEPCSRNEAGNIVNVQLAPDVVVDFGQLTRHVFASSSCGLCGKASIDAVRGNFCRIVDDGDWSIEAESLVTFPTKMREAQSSFEKTGGIHAAALFDEAGNRIVLREDVGRHNAVDKVLGYALMQGIVPLRRHVLLVSGRSSFEIMQKALAAGVPLVAAVSAPSSLAVEFARDSGQTLVGFLRDNRMNVYSHPHRVRFTQPVRPAETPGAFEPPSAVP